MGTVRPSDLAAFEVDYQVELGGLLKSASQRLCCLGAEFLLSGTYHGHTISRRASQARTLVEVRRPGWRISLDTRASSPAIGCGAESSSRLSERCFASRNLSRSLWTGVAGGL